jgi:hypothetical protein
MDLIDLNMKNIKKGEEAHQNVAPDSLHWCPHGNEAIDMVRRRVHATVVDGKLVLFLHT